MDKNTYGGAFDPNKPENPFPSSGFEALDRQRNEIQPSTPPPLWQNDFVQDSADTSGSFGSGWDQSFFLGNQSSQVFDGGSLNSLINAELSTQDLQGSSESDLSSDMDESVNPNLHLEIVKFEKTTPGGLTSSSETQQPYPGVEVNFLRSPLVRSKSSHQLPAFPVTIVRPRSSSFPPPTAVTTSEILGQIISKHSVDGVDEYLDIGPFVTFPQHEAARKLNLPSSTLSKKWKDATVNRKWPYRTLAKIDKEIATIMHNINRNSNGIIGKETEAQLAQLLHQRQAEMRPVIVRMN